MEDGADTFSSRGVDALLWIESFSQARLLVSQHTLRPLRHSLKERPPYTGRAE